MVLMASFNYWFPVKMTHSEIKKSGSAADKEAKA